MNITEAYKSMQKGKITHFSGGKYFYRYKDRSYQVSPTIDFKDSFNFHGFTEKAILADWEVVEQNPKCHFCGSKCEVMDYAFFSGPMVKVAECTNSKCRARSPYGDSKEEAIENHEDIVAIHSAIKSRCWDAT